MECIIVLNIYQGRMGGIVPMPKGAWVGAN